VRILFLARSLHLGGAEAQLVSLARGLQDRGHDVVVATFYAGGSLSDPAHAAGLRCVDLGKDGRWDFARTAWRLARLTREFRPDVAYSFLQGANITLALTRPLLACRVYAWGVRASNMLFDFHGREAHWVLRAECLLSRMAHAVICNSESGAAFYSRQGVASQRLRVIRNGIDGELFRRDVELARHLRAEQGVTGNVRVIGIVGRVDPVKDHRTALTACGVLAAKGMNVEVWIVGAADAASRTALEQHAEKVGMQGRIRWLGVRHDMRAVYSALDVLLSASLSEGFPNVVAEAAACGTPCVVTDVGDSAAIVDDARCVVRPGAADEMATAVARVLAGGGGGASEWRARIMGRFDRETFIARTESALRDLVEEHS
jgi:glycosyltransferase involved in cell wall biosynthesis